MNNLYVLKKLLKKLMLLKRHLQKRRELNELSKEFLLNLDINYNGKIPKLNLRLKLEEELKKLPFTSLHIYQPSFLTGKRKEFRLGDKIALVLFGLLNPLLLGPLRKYRSIKAETVATFIFKQSLKELRGIFTYPSIQIQKLA